MLNLIRREPALVVGVVLAAIGVLSAFGLGITQGQSDAIVSLVGAVLAIVGAGVTRSRVTPVGRHRRNEGGRVDLLYGLGVVALVLFIAWLAVRMLG